MPQPPTLKINEFFPSFQGEGLRQGEPTLFIRLSGCNLRCPFCDTRAAWEEGRDMKLPLIMEQVERMRREFPADWICITGGEPLVQDISPLLSELKATGLWVQVETNGTRSPQFPVDWYTVSPKPDHYSFETDFLLLAKEVKLVITAGLDIAVLLMLRSRFPESVPVLLQPESNKQEAMLKTERFLKETLQAGLRNIRISIQMHKIYGWR